MKIRLIFLSALISVTLIDDAKAQVMETGMKDVLSVQTQQLNLACQLVRYGYQTKSAMPLVLAVQMFRNQKAEVETIIATKVEVPSSQEGDGRKKEKLSFEEKQIIEDATVFASGNVNMLNLLKDLQVQTRGVLPGNNLDRRVNDCVNAESTDVWKVRLRGGERVYVIIVGDGDTDLDAFVYDKSGNKVADDSWCDDGQISFTPRWTGEYIIKIKNLGKVYNCYTMTIIQS